MTRALPAAALAAALLLLGAGPAPPNPAPRTSRPPNIVVLLADDLGYGDLSSYGHPLIRTPHIDRIGREGVRLTAFYVASSVCTPSRAALLTGRYPTRSGVTRVLFPNDSVGLPASEVTMAEALRARGYRTAAIGKWHLGDRARFLPTAHGFDSYLGVPYSNDMDDRAQGHPPTPLVRDTTVVEQPADQATLTARYTDEALRVIRESAGRRPFFVYLAYTMPHVPLHASAAFRGRSRAGLYGDVVEELDAGVGRVLAALREAGEEGNTIVVFTSDNGPWLTLPAGHLRAGMRPWHGGSAGMLRGAKMSTYEGGFRVPALVRWPGRIPAGRVSAAPATTMDLYPTLLAAAGAAVPRDRPVDGRDLGAALAGRGPSPTRELFYTWYEGAHAVRSGPWKLRMPRMPEPGAAPPGGAPAPAPGGAPELYHLDLDPGERYDVAAEHPDVVGRLRARLEAFPRDVRPAAPAPPAARRASATP